MPRSSRVNTLFVLTVACAATLVSASVWAQTTPLSTVSGGVAGISDGEVSMPGVYVEGERRLTRILSAVGQVHRTIHCGRRRLRRPAIATMH